MAITSRKLFYMIAITGWILALAFLPKMASANETAEQVVPTEEKTQPRQLYYSSAGLSFTYWRDDSYPWKWYEVNQWPAITK